MINGATRKLLRDSCTYASLIRECVLLDRGKLLHLEILEAGLANDRLLGNLLVQMYGRCRSMQDAVTTFESISGKNVFSWAIIITAFANNGHLQRAEDVFTKMPYINTVALTSMLSSLASGGRLNSANDMFESIPQKDVISWNAMIAAFAQNGHPYEALEVFSFMELEGVQATEATLVSVIDACATIGDVQRASYFHTCIFEGSFIRGVKLETAIVNMYGKCGDVVEAKAVFDAMDVRNVVSWNTMISAFTRNSEGNLAVSTFLKMMHDGMKPDQATFSSVLDAYSTLNIVEEACNFCEMVQAEGIEKDLVLSTALINIYGECGRVEAAKCEFDKAVHRDTASWNAMISAYRKNEQGNMSLQLFWIMNLEGVKADKVTIVAVLDACASRKMFSQGTSIRENVIQGSEFETDNMVQTAFVSMCGKLGNFDEAKMAFEGMNRRDCVAWNAAIAACAQNGYENEALDMFKLMDLDGVVADDATYVSILDACAYAGRNTRYTRNGYIKEAFKLAITNDDSSRLNEMFMGVELNVANALMNVNAKSGRIENAKCMFDAMNEKCLISWNTMLAAYAERGYTSEAFRMLVLMDQEGICPDSITFASILDACGNGKATDFATSIIEECRLHNMEASVLLNVLVTMYGKCGNVTKARKYFDETLNRDLVSWNAMLGVYVQNGYANEALDLFCRMDLEGVSPDEITCIEIIEGCSILADLRLARLIHYSIADSYMEFTELIANSLVNMYAKCGSLKEAKRTFRKIRNPSGVSWNAMVGAYAQFGHGTKAREMSRSMELEGSRASHLTFMSTLSALSHKGFVYEAWDYFVSIRSDYDVESGMDQYICIVDLLSRVGELEAAEEIIRCMPYEPGHIAWATLLAACSTHGDIFRGIHAAKELVSLCPDKAAPYILLANIVSADLLEGSIEFLLPKQSQTS